MPKGLQAYGGLICLKLQRNFIEDWIFETHCVSVLHCYFYLSKNDKRTILETFYAKMRKVFKSCGIKDFVPFII